MKAKISDFRYMIFDVDGTLLDNRKFYRKILLLVLSLAWGKNKNISEDHFTHFAPDSNELYLPMGGVPLPQLVWRFHRFPGLNRIALIIEEGILKLCDAMDRKEPGLFEETKEVLYHLHKEGIKLFASTGSKTPDAIVRLQKVGISDLFTSIVGSDIVPKRKQIPYFADYTHLPIKKFARQTCLVGDGPVELILASKYGVYGIGITNTLRSSHLLKAGAKEVISNLKELLN